MLALILSSRSAALIRRLASVLTLCLLLWTTALGQIEQVIDSTAGGAATIDGVGPLAVGIDGALFVAGINSNNVVRIDPTGAVELVLDGSGAGEPLFNPTDLAVDTVGNIYVVGQASNNVFRITTLGAEVVLNAGLVSPHRLGG